MKKFSIKVGLFAALMELTLSCDQEFLNTKPLDKISSQNMVMNYFRRLLFLMCTLS
jgi:hypothetical protein